MAKLHVYANSGDPDQMPHSAASDLGLYCLPITLLQVSRLQWVNPFISAEQTMADIYANNLDPDETARNDTVKYIYHYALIPQSKNFLFVITAAVTDCLCSGQS